MRVLDAWRLYHSELGISAQGQPLELFSAFLEKYGVTLNAADRTGKLFLYETIDAPPADVPLENWIRPVGADVGVVGYLDARPSALFGKIIIVVAYAYSLAQYVEGLRKHHVFLGDLSELTPRRGVIKLF